MSDRFIKIGFTAIALFAVVFGFMRLGQNIKLTFSEGDSQEEAKNSDSILEETKLKISDTDEDGLNDWDEINNYNTSPYLTDSDSDGINDLDEVKKGTDPNCPTGKECGTSLQRGSATTQSTPATDASATENAETSLPLEELKNLSADEIRELLQQGGVTDEQLQGVNDEQLRQLLEETLNQQ